jgi:hypothetical protein
MAQDFDPFRRVKAFTGTGTVTAGDRSMICRFDAHQRGDGAITIACEGDADASQIAKLMAPWPWDVEFSGTTSDGLLLTTSAAHVVSSTFKVFSQAGPVPKLRIIAGGLDAVGEATATTLRFGLTNLRKIQGNEKYSYTTPDGQTGARLRIRLRLGEFDVVIDHREDAETVLKEAATTRGVGLTAEATVAVEPGQVASADQAVSTLCDLLTLGQGAAVNWIYRDSLDEGGRVIATFCGNAITKPLGSSLALISDADMCAFVQAAFNVWEEADTRWEIRKAVLGYTDGKSPIDYLEARTVKMVVVFEHLKRVYLDRTNREYLLPDALFKSKVGDLGRIVANALQELFPEQPPETLRRLAGGLQGLHRTSFRAALKGVASDLRLPLDSRELDDLVEIRNRLVHAMQFSENVKLEKFQQFLLLTTLAGKLILAALRYEGPYYDWTTTPPRQAQLTLLPGAPS